MRVSSGIRIFDILLVLAALSLASYFSLDWAMEGLIHNRRERMVPDLRNKSVDAALDLVSPLNLALKKDGEEFHDSVPIGSIVRQLPLPGTTVREGKIIRVVVSQGGETVFVPTISGLPLRNAEMLLRQRNLGLGEVSESYSVRMEKGRVLNQDPPAEQPVEKSALVNVVVSAGRPPAGVVLMPDFRQKNVAEAQAWAKGLGLDLKESVETASLFPKGAILSQEPPPDTVVTDKSGLKVLVSGRPDTGSEAVATRSLHYEVSQGSSDSLVRIVIVDPYGEREVFNEVRPPGSKIDLAIPDTGKAARARIFVNGILIEEREL
jgi:eukaryotic-like serine/threonine-protein kinase